MSILMTTRARTVDYEHKHKKGLGFPVYAGIQYIVKYVSPKGVCKAEKDHNS